MKKKAIKRALITTLLSVFVLMCVVLLSGVGIYGRCSIHVGDYDDFYLYKKNSIGKAFLNIGGGAASGYTVWFLPGQKDKMLSQIKQDVHDELTDIVEKNSDLFTGFEISDDFYEVNIFYYKDARNYGLNPSSARRIDEIIEKIYNKTVQLKIELYHNFIYGHKNVELSSNTICMVEVERV